MQGASGLSTLSNVKGCEKIYPSLRKASRAPKCAPLPLNILSHVYMHSLMYSSLQFPKAQVTYPTFIDKEGEANAKGPMAYKWQDQILNPDF